MALDLLAPAIVSPARPRAAVLTSSKGRRAGDPGAVLDIASIGSAAARIAISQVPDLSGRDRLPRPWGYIDRLSAGDPAAYAQLVGEHGPMMLAVASRYLHRSHDAEDAVQDALLNVFRSISRFKRKSSIVTWLHRIVVNCALMRLRTQRRKPLLTLEESALGGSVDLPGRRSTPRSAHDAVEAGETMLLVRAAIDSLPARERQILTLHGVDAIEMGQIAEVLDVGSSTAKVVLHRARRRLAAALPPGHSHYARV